MTGLEAQKVPCLSASLSLAVLTLSVALSISVLSFSAVLRLWEESSKERERGIEREKTEDLCAARALEGSKAARLLTQRSAAVATADVLSWQHKREKEWKKERDTKK